MPAIIIFWVLQSLTLSHSGTAHPSLPAALPAGSDVQWWVAGAGPQSSWGSPPDNISHLSYCSTVTSTLYISQWLLRSGWFSEGGGGQTPHFHTEYIRDIKVRLQHAGVGLWDRSILPSSDDKKSSSRESCSNTVSMSNVENLLWRTNVKRAHSESQLLFVFGDRI